MECFFFKGSGSRSVDVQCGTFCRGDMSFLTNSDVSSVLLTFIQDIKNPVGCLSIFVGARHSPEVFGTKDTRTLAIFIDLHIIS